MGSGHQAQWPMAFTLRRMRWGWKWRHSIEMPVPIEWYSVPTKFGVLAGILFPLKFHWLGHVLLAHDKEQAASIWWTLSASWLLWDPAMTSPAFLNRRKWSSLTCPLPTRRLTFTALTPHLSQCPCPVPGGFAVYLCKYKFPCPLTTGLVMQLVLTNRTVIAWWHHQKLEMSLLLVACALVSVHSNENMPKPTAGPRRRRDMWRKLQVSPAKPAGSPHTNLQAWELIKAYDWMPLTVCGCR